MVTKGDWANSHEQDGYTQVLYGNEIHKEQLCSISWGMTIPKEQRKANADIMVEAVNACKSINPDNPMAAAKSITDVYEALKNANNVLVFVRDKSGYKDGSIGKLECERAIDVNEEALSKAKEKS